MCIMILNGSFKNFEILKSWRKLNLNERCLPIDILLLCVYLFDYPLQKWQPTFAKINLPCSKTLFFPKEIGRNPKLM